MNDHELTQEPMQDMPGPSEDDLARWEAEAEEYRKTQIAPFAAAAQQRKQNAAIIADHDNALAEMLFEMTMKDLEV